MMAQAIEAVVRFLAEEAVSFLAGYAVSLVLGFLGGSPPMRAAPAAKKGGLSSCSFRLYRHSLAGLPLLSDYPAAR